MTLQCQRGTESIPLNLWALYRTDTGQLICARDDHGMTVMQLYPTSKLAAAYRLLLPCWLPIVSQQATFSRLAEWCELMVSRGARYVEILLEEPSAGDLCERLLISSLLLNIEDFALEPRSEGVK